MSTGVRRAVGFTLIEVLTGIVAVVVVIAVAIPMWRTHQLKVRRGEAIEALLAVQAAQDLYFATHARYADGSQLLLEPPDGLGLQATSARKAYAIRIERAADSLGYVAIARATDASIAGGDPRCAELRLDQHGQRSAFNSEGEDSSADCWNQL